MEINSMTDLITLITPIVLAILFFLIIRGLNLWYWRINDSIAIQEKIYKEMKEIKELIKEKETEKIT